MLDTFTTFGDLLKFLRVRAQLTQRDLSIAVGYSEAQISRQESNKRVPGEYALKALYIPALGLEDEPEVVTLLVTLAAKARGETVQHEKASVREPPSWTKVQKSNLPAPLSSFIGREQEITEVCQNVLQHRLVTITGAGGVGKTRLALRAAEEMMEYFTDGAWLVELAPVSDPTLVLRVVSGVLGVQEQPGQDLHQTLVRILRARRLLLILDNCEHLIDGTGGLAVQLLQGCTHLHILATSRELLGVEGEFAFRCPSLSQPGEEDQKSHGQTYLDEVGQSEAVRLFVERARAACPEFQLSEANVLPVVQICRRLDGIPLAIELAAARTRMLSVEQIAARLDHAFDLLTGSSRQALPRHQTLKALIAWSYQLLAPGERILLQRLSVFAGGWTLDAAEQVCADRLEEAASASLAQVSSGQIMDLLGRLIDKSMVRFEPGGGGEPRYRMLDTVRQFAHEFLVTSGEGPATRDRHLDYFLTLAMQAEPHLRGLGSNSWLSRLEHELDNIRQALDWSVSVTGFFDSARLTNGLKLAASLHWLWWGRNFASEGMGWLERLLAEQTRLCIPQALSLEEKVARGRAMNVLTRIIMDCQSVGILLPNGSSAQSLYKESQAIFLELGEAYRRDYALARFLEVDYQEQTEENYLVCRELFYGANDLFWVSECDKDLAIFYELHQQDFEKATLACERSLSIKKEIGDLDGQAVISAMLGFYEFLRGNERRSVDLVKESINFMDQVGNRWFAASKRFDMADFFIQRGNYEDAANLLEIAYRLAHKLHDPLLIMDCDRIQAYLALERGAYEQAVGACENIMEMREDFPHSKIAQVFYILARLALSRGEASQARASLKGMLDHDAFSVGDIRLRMMHALGLLAVQEGRWACAGTWLGARDAMCAQSFWASCHFSPMERKESDQARAASREALGEEAFCAAWEAGQVMSEEQLRKFAEESLFTM